MFDRLLLSTPVEGVRQVLLATATLSRGGNAPVRVHVAALAHDALNGLIFDAFFRGKAREEARWEAAWEEGSFAEDDTFV